MRAMPNGNCAQVRFGGGARFAGLVLAFLLGSFASFAGLAVATAHAAKPRIAVLSLTADQLSAEVRAKIDAAVAGGLAASGADVVDSDTTARRIAARGLGGCETSTCRVAIAEVTGAGYLVRGAVESMGRSYTVHLEMIDGASGVVIGIHEDRCEICTEGEAYETASATASALKAEVLKRPGAGPAAGNEGKPGSKLSAASAVAPSASGGVAAISSPQPAPAADGRAAPRLGALSWIGVGAGAVAIGAGIYLLRLDGHGNCDDGQGVYCPLTYSGNRPGGFTLIGAGALVLTVSAALLIARF
jgi:hypothetical protein